MFAPSLPWLAFQQKRLTALLDHLSPLVEHLQLALHDAAVGFGSLRLLEHFHDPVDTMTPEHRKNYLYKIAANLVKREARKRSEQEVADLPGPESAEQIDEWIGIRNALDRMKAAERSLLWLAYVEGFSHREIGAIAGYAENSVRPLLHRAKQRLLRFLSGDAKSGREEQ